MSPTPSASSHLDDAIPKAGVVLVLNRDAEARGRLAAYIERHGFAALEAGSVPDVSAALSDHPVDIVVAETELAAAELSDLFRFASLGLLPPLMVLARAADPVDRIVALELGADDLMDGQGSPRELLARIRAILRRAARPGAQAAALTSVGVMHWRLDRSTRALTCADGAVVHLTRAEAQLFGALLAEPGALVPRTALEQAAGVRRDRSARSPIDKMISRIRAKVSEASVAGFPVRSVSGAGYVFDETPSSVRPRRDATGGLTLVAA